MKINKIIAILSILVGLFLQFVYLIQKTFLGVTVCSVSNNNLLLNTQISSILFITLGIISLIIRNPKLKLIINWLLLILMIIFLLLTVIFNKITVKKYALCETKQPLIIVPTNHG